MKILFTFLLMYFVKISINLSNQHQEFGLIENKLQLFSEATSDDDETPREEMLCYVCSPKESNCLNKAFLTKEICAVCDDYRAVKKTVTTKELKYLRPRCYFVQYVTHKHKIKRRYGCTNKTIEDLVSNEPLPICDYFEAQKVIGHDGVAHILSCKTCLGNSCNKPPSGDDDHHGAGYLRCYHCRPFRYSVCEENAEHVEDDLCADITEYTNLMDQTDFHEFQYLQPECFYLEFFDENDVLQRSYGCMNTTMDDKEDSDVKLPICEYFSKLEAINHVQIKTIEFCSTCRSEQCNDGISMKDNKTQRDSGSGAKSVQDELDNVILFLLICFTLSYQLTNCLHSNYNTSYSLLL